MALVWTMEEYGTGFEEVDEQHQALFTHINRLIETIDRGDGEAELHILVQFLSGYLATHFVCEERLMKRHNCGSCKLNEAEHRRFAKDFSAFKERFRETGPTDELAHEIKTRMVAWVA